MATRSDKRSRRVWSLMTFTSTQSPPNDSPTVYNMHHLGVLGSVGGENGMGLPAPTASDIAFGDSPRIWKNGWKGTRGLGCEASSAGWPGRGRELRDCDGLREGKVFVDL